MYPHIHKSYTMPDGTKTLNMPKDGQTFYTLDGRAGTSRLWQWDGLKEQWFVKQTLQDDAHPDFDQDMELANKRSAVRCECGSEKVGSPIHSDWCPKK